MGNTVEQWRASIGGWTSGSIAAIGSKCRGCSCSSSPWFELLVLVALLVIGGVEMNPGPNQNEMATYEKTKGFANMAGELYEVKLSALLFLRALQTGQHFQLASNMEVAGCFDDVVLTLGDCTMFLQLKHKEKSETVLRLSDLASHKDFNLPKYLKSYLEVKKRWQDGQADLQLCGGKFEDAKFVIYTNARVHEGLVNIAGSAELLDIVSTGGTCVCLTELLDSLPKYKAALSAAVSSENVTETPELLEVVHKLYNKEARALPDKKKLQKMLEDLETLEDLSQHQQFISQLYLCIGQAAEKDVDKLIKDEIHSDTLLRNFLANVQNWWRTSNCYITRNSQFWQDVLNTCAANIIKPSPTIKVKFVEEHCNAIRQLTSGNRMLYIYTQCTVLSCLKVLQSFQTNLLVDVNILQTSLTEVLAVWRLGMCDVLVVEGETTDTDILDNLGSMPDPKCVVVISDKAEHTQLYQQFKFVPFTDTFSLSQLESDSQTYVLEQEVVFQGFAVKLNSLAEASFLQNHVTADVVVQLHHTLQVGQQLDELDPCYIHRTFLRKEFVSEQIFRQEHITLAVTGISEDRLAQLLLPGGQVQRIKTCKCFRIEGEAEFTALCGNNDNIHWVEAREGGFVWIKSKGDMSPLIKHLEDKNVHYTGKDVLALPHQVVLVVAEPGMGKTTEMCNMAHIIKQKDPSMWVVRIDLNQYTLLLSQNQVDAVEFLETVVTLNSEFQKRLFEHELQSGGNVLILVDGVDEVCPNYSDQVIRLLKQFSVMKVKQIFVTSRPVMLNELQQNLSTVAFSLHQFTPDDQKNFLVRFWNQLPVNSSELSINSSELSKFISSLLEFVGTSLNDNLKELTGIPLQCKMLAEVYTDDAAHFCETGEVRLPQTLDILELYDKFIDKKWEVYWKKMKVDINIAFSLVEDAKDMNLIRLMCCALVSYLRDDDVRKLYNSANVLKEHQNFLRKFNVGQVKIGIVTHIVGDKAVFVHRTFTEYFVAVWCSQNFDMESVIMKKIFFDENFIIVRKCLDRILTKGLKLHTFVLNENLTEVKNVSTENSDANEKDEGGRIALHLAIMNYFHEVDKKDDSIVETLLEHGADIGCEDKVLHWRPLRLAEEVRAWSVVDKLLEKQADSKDLVWIRANIEKQNFAESESEMSVRYVMSESLEQIMFTALREGYVNLVDFILKCGVSVTHHITDNDGDKSTMLHLAAECGQLKLVQFLIQQGADVDVSDVDNTTPLMRAAYYGRVEVVQLLIANSACLNGRNKYEHTALSLAAYMGKNEVVKLLLKHTTYDTNDIDSVIWGAGGGDMEAVQYLTDNKIINSQDKVGCTALFVAAQLGNNETVKLLLQQGADIDISDMHNRTPLMLAAHWGHVEVTQLLIAHGASVNTRNRNGHTAISLAAHGGKNEVVKLLLQQGADVEISDMHNRTPLMLTAAHGHVEVVQLLIAHGASVNTRDNHGLTALSCAHDDNIKQLLLQHGAQE